MAEVGSAVVSIMPSARGFGSMLNSQVGGEVTKSGKMLGGMFGKAIGVTAIAAGVGVGKALYNPGPPAALPVYFTGAGG